MQAILLEQPNCFVVASNVYEDGRTAYQAIVRSEWPGQYPEAPPSEAAEVAETFIGFLGPGHVICYADDAAAEIVDLILQVVLLDAAVYMSPPSTVTTMCLLL
jgi:hypothetical protein